MHASVSNTCLQQMFIYFIFFISEMCCYLSKRNISKDRQCHGKIDLLTKVGICYLLVSPERSCRDNLIHLSLIKSVTKSGQGWYMGFGTANVCSLFSATSYIFFSLIHNTQVNIKLVYIFSVRRLIYIKMLYENRRHCNLKTSFGNVTSSQNVSCSQNNIINHWFLYVTHM